MTGGTDGFVCAACGVSEGEEARIDFLRRKKT